MCAPVLRRFVDVVGIDKETKEVVELHQVGVGTKKSGAIKREREAYEDILNSADYNGAPMHFYDYVNGKKIPWRVKKKK